LKLLFDNNVSPKVARAIHELISPHDVAVPLRDKFSHGAKDIEWIAELGKEGGWCVVSGDLRITKNKAEKAAWLQTDLIGFFMEPAMAKLPPIEQTARLLLRLPLIEAQIALIRGPALFSLPIGNSSKLRQL
jgi:hypothetical protein